ncbi:EAL domain-containing protein [Sulfuricurvum sp.]|uniref:putative bifunctional diguanylate cyclase/phosphodiesterase n=1 Tax=Sulfuricurvum sp. TaxID=2025608 RepID=UPI0026083E0E|nr:EAL domain-containing protein [Sulfuricurvum sp.]MDD2267197.1 EAL domain-containing protein [Sulfuricurvum sp.]MDD2782782.1 EAL domain-containing protein [Sulfuricurvum sp.]
MMFLSKTRLSYKIVGSLILIFLLILMSIGTIVSIVFENTILVSEKQKANLLLETIEKPLQIALYLKFYDQISQKVAPAVSVPDVTELEIRDQSGKRLYFYTHSKEHLKSRHEAMSVTHILKEPTSGELMGSVTLRYSDLAYEETRKSIHKIVYGVWVSIAVIFFAAVWWVRYLLSPLTKIAKKVRYYKPGDQMMFEEDGSVEIEQIVTAFNTMQKTTQHYLEQMETMNSSLEMKVNEKTRELETQFYTDQLTNLPNRYKLQEILLQGDLLALAIVNIDDFKEVNDFFGISIGDEILKQFALWLKELSSASYRLGGDEFALVFSNLYNQNELEHRLNILAKLLDEKTFVVKEESFNIRISIGVAMGNEKVLTRADIALHHAKANRKQIAFYNHEEGIEEQYRSNLTMASNVRRALFDNRIICHYQPIVNLNTGMVHKYETLVRMIDDEGNIIPPIKFLSIAKQTKLYPRITLEVVYQACTLFASRKEEFSINLSDSDIRNPHTVSEIIKTITETGTADRIVFEILESEGIESYEEVTRFISQVKVLGAKIAIDDFGTGYSNFENILKLGVDYIKIDGSLIREIAGNSRHHIIVETIIDFAKKIDAKTIAEFVSDEEIYNTIKAIGVDYSQGYFTGKPTSLL